jgi:hypothetical protein
MNKDAFLDGYLYKQAGWAGDAWNKYTDLASDALSSPVRAYNAAKNVKEDVKQGYYGLKRKYNTGAPINNLVGAFNTFSNIPKMVDDTKKEFKNYALGAGAMYMGTNFLNEQANQQRHNELMKALKQNRVDPGNYTDKPAWRLSTTRKEDELYGNN